MTFMVHRNSRAGHLVSVLHFASTAAGARMANLRGGGTMLGGPDQCKINGGLP